MLLTMGIALIISEMGVILWGGYPRVMAQPPSLAGVTRLGSFTSPLTGCLSLLRSGVPLSLGPLKNKSRRYVRACVDDEEKWFEGMGVNCTPPIYIYVWIYLLAGRTGVLLGLPSRSLSGAEFDILFFVIGRRSSGWIGKPRGALIASLFIGILDSLGKGYYPELAHFTLSAPMLIVLAVKPTGLLGKG
jgi:branched-chain amino acid transport system permease protein